MRNHKRVVSHPHGILACLNFPPRHFAFFPHQLLIGLRREESAITIDYDRLKCGLGEMSKTIKEALKLEDTTAAHVVHQSQYMSSKTRNVKSMLSASVNHISKLQGVYMECFWLILYHVDDGYDDVDCWVLDVHGNNQQSTLARCG